MYSPVRSDAHARAERDRLEEDIRFVAKSVRLSVPGGFVPNHSTSPILIHASTRGTQIANVCITLNEFPYIRYYVPAHHGPLGALRPHETTRAAARPPENSLRWRTNLARGEHARQYEAAEAEVLSRMLAFQVQAALDEYKRANPEFPVRLRSGALLVVCSLLCARMDIDRLCENRNRIGRDNVQR
jgi:syntaxin-binding protein 1